MRKNRVKTKTRTVVKLPVISCHGLFVALFVLLLLCTAIYVFTGQLWTLNAAYYISIVSCCVVFFYFAKEI